MASDYEREVGERTLRKVFGLAGRVGACVRAEQVAPRCRQLASILSGVASEQGHHTGNILGGTPWPPQRLPNESHL